MMASNRLSRWQQGLAVIMLLGTTLLAACGGNEATPTTGAGAQAGGTSTAAATTGAAQATETPTTAAAANAGATVTPTFPPRRAGAIEVAVVRGAMLDTVRTLATKYKQASGNDVDVVEEPEGGAYDALIAAGNQPDMFFASFGSQIGKYASTQVVVPLEDMPGASDIYGKVDPTTVEQLYGHNYYMPIGLDITMMIYNKELFQQAGLDPNKPPVTWDEFLADAEKIQSLPPVNGSKVYGTVFWNDALAWGGWYWNMLQPIYLNANQGQCQLLNKLGTDIVFDKPECKMADFFTFTQKAQKFAPPTMEKNFFSRTIGMWPQYGYSWEPNLKEAAGKPMVIGQDVAVAPVPVEHAGDKSFSTLGGRALMIFKTSPDRQSRAWDFIKFLMQDQNSLQFDKELGYLPVLTSLKGDAYFADPARKPFVDALSTAKLPEMYASAEDVANQVQGVYQQAVVQGGMAPDQAVTTAAQKARGALQK